MQLSRPKFLKKGDLIEYIAPSYGTTTEPYATRMNVADENFKKWGFLTSFGPNVYRNDGVVASASPEERANEAMDAFRGDASLVLSVGGGETMDEILPYLDFAALKRLPPKWFMGFSDNTNLVFPLTTIVGWQAIYGPCAPQFFQAKPRLSEKDALRMLRGETHFEGYPKYSITPNDPAHPLWAYRLTKEKIITPVDFEEPVEGILVGGCMDCLCNLCGTRFDQVKKFEKKHPEGIIWFLEACDLSPLDIRRGLFQLREAGWFDNAKAILFGRPLCGDANWSGVDRFNAATDILGELEIPMLFDIDLGHVSPSMPIRSGAYARVNYVDGNIVFDYLED